MISKAIVLASIMFCETGHLEGEARLKAKGDYWNGKYHSFGCMQIQPTQALADVNRIYKTSYTKEDCFDEIKAKKICWLYLTYWIERYEINTKKKATFSDYLKCWNGGPHFYKKTKPETIKRLNNYAEKGLKYARDKKNWY
jgi:hypothetical protein